jgi:capsular exopolysaccharide synthesis family protein
VQAQLTAVEAAFQKKRANIIARVRNEYNAAMRQEQLLSRDYSTQSRLVSAQGDKITRYTNLKHEVDATRQLYDAMVQRVREAGVASALRASEIRVIEPATPPLNPFRPNLFYNLALGWFSAVLLGVTVIIARARSDHGVQGPGETSAYLQVPELGVIPAGNAVGAVRQPLWPGRGEARRLELTMCEQRQSIMAESFRLALTSILLSEPNGTRPHVIALSSANPGEGKTMVTCNLAIALAESRGPVLLIDGDLHRPRLHEVFDVDNDLGLVEALAGAPLNLRQTKIPNLHLLTSGKRQAEGVFFASDFHQLIRQVKGQFNTVLIDTPPLLQVADARLIARRADAVILVVAQHTPRDAVLLARQWLAEDGSALLGTILNNWNAKGAAYGYQKYRYYGNSDYRNQ